MRPNQGLSQPDEGSFAGISWAEQVQKFLQVGAAG